MTMRLSGASVMEEELYAHLTSHEEQEGELLGEYQQAAVSSPSLAFRYLASLIVEDEVRHHLVFGQLASALKTDAEMGPGEPAVPRLDHWGPDAPHLVELTKRLLESEHADARELRHMARDLHDLKDTTMWQLLVKLMEMDTAKHIAILEFVKGHAGKNAWWKG